MFSGVTSGNTMAIVPAEAPESSSHTGKELAQSDAVAPTWFSTFMQMSQVATQTTNDKLSSMDNMQLQMLTAVQDMQVTLTLQAQLCCIHLHHMSCPVIGIPWIWRVGRLRSACALSGEAAPIPVSPSLSVAAIQTRRCSV